MTMQLGSTFEMFTHLQQLAEREKAAMARELHDDLGGCLIGAVMDLSTLASLITALGPDAHHKIARARRALGEAIEISRRITEQLRPTLLDNVGLFTALRWQLKCFALRTQIKCTDDLPANEPQLSSNAAIVLFRSAQEALVVGMERPDVTELKLAASLNDRELSLRLSADGSSSPEISTDVIKLLIESVRHRIRSLGGTFKVEHVPSGGMLMTITTPTVNVTA